MVVVVTLSITTTLTAHACVHVERHVAVAVTKEVTVVAVLVAVWRVTVRSVSYWCNLCWSCLSRSRCFSSSRCYRSCLSNGCAVRSVTVWCVAVVVSILTLCVTASICVHAERHVAITSTVTPTVTRVVEWSPPSLS